MATNSKSPLSVKAAIYIVGALLVLLATNALISWLQDKEHAAFRQMAVKVNATVQEQDRDYTNRGTPFSQAKIFFTDQAGKTHNIWIEVTTHEFYAYPVNSSMPILYDPSNPAIVQSEEFKPSNWILTQSLLQLTVVAIIGFLILIIMNRRRHIGSPH
jgi:hypothetical protein